MSDQLGDCENDIVTQLRAQLPYLTSCEDIGDPKTAMELEDIVTPAIRVMFAADSAGGPMHLSASRQLTRLRWNIFLIASNFAPSIEGRHDQPVSGGTEQGIYTMLKDVRSALRGFALPSQAPFTSKLFSMGAEIWTIGESSVVFVDRWYNDVIGG